jgi:hypothetical protein
VYVLLASISTVAAVSNRDPEMAVLVYHSPLSQIRMGFSASTGARIALSDGGRT